jgi:hypothetical protein
MLTEPFYWQFVGWPGVAVECPPDPSWVTGGPRRQTLTGVYFLNRQRTELEEQAARDPDVARALGVAATAHGCRPEDLTPVPGFHPSGTQGRVGTWTIHCDCEDALPPGTPLTLSPLDAPDPIRARSRGFNPVELREDVVGTYLPDPLDRRPRVRRLSVFHGACRTCGEVYCAVSRTSERS